MNLRTTAAGMCLVAAGAQADTEGSSVPRVEIVGSRVPRIDAETALPIQIIRREEIERSGVTSVEELMDRVSANFGSLREATSNAASGNSGTTSVTLRGLPGQTLVLLNGRRIANYAFRFRMGQAVDLHAIPLAAIERVEVLKDGASALYGSDAIGGVVNFVTRSDFSGVDVFASYTKTQDGGADAGRATLAGGAGQFDSDGFNVFGVLDLRDASRLGGADRSFSSTPYRPELGLAALDPRNFPANIRIPVSGGGGFAIVGPSLPACTPTSFPVQKGLQNGCFFNTTTTTDLLPASRQVDFFGRGALRLSGELDVYAEALASSSHIGHEAPPTAVSTTASQRGTPFVLPASSPYYPTGLGLSGDLSLAYRSVPLGPATTEVDTRNGRLLAGIRWRQWGWDIDGAAATNWTRSRERYVSGMVDAGRLSAAFATGLLNPFGPSGPEGDALLAASEVRGPSRDSTGRTQSVDLRAVGELAKLAGGPLAMAIGVEARHESLEDAQLAISGDVLDLLPAPAKAGARSVQAGYVEVVAPLLQGFEVQLAARVDHYSDFGTSTSPKIALRLTPAPSWLLRASAGRGFMAPGLPDLFSVQAHSTLELAIVGLTDPIRCPVTHLASDCNPTLDVVSGGNPALKPQRSTQFSLGFGVAPSAGWLVTLDAWTIRIEDIIGRISQTAITRNLSLYEGRNLERGPADPAFPGLPGPLVRINTLNQNLGDWQTSGADVSLSTPWATTEVGRISARLDGTYIGQSRQQIFEGNAVDLVGRVVPGSQPAMVPRWQHVATFNLDREHWIATLTQRYRQGHVDQYALPDGSTRRVAAYQLWDAQVQVTAWPNVTLLFGVQNLLNTDPPFSNVDPGLGYDPSYADPRGRRWTLGVRARWL